MPTDTAKGDLVREILQGLCRGCGHPLESNRDKGLADGCACNAPRGVNHGLIPVNVCTCPECDPAQTGAVRR